jgi:ADP-ribose pyrophosphatase YjhB (NUDIX family)
MAGRHRRDRRHLPRVEETSAGGLVLDALDAASGPVVPRGVLIGKRDRRGRLVWSLPKGHVEAGEAPQDTAVREVAEETGIQGRVVGELGTIDFWFVLHGKRIHKTVHHYLMLAEGGELSDSDVEVAAVAWVPLAELDDRLAYDDERELVARVPELLAR